MSARKAEIERDNPADDLLQIAESGDVAKLQRVLGRGADVNACDDSGVTALMVAAYHGRLEMVKALLEHGAELNAANSEGLTAAMLADDAGHEETVRHLVALGIKRNRTSHVPEPQPSRFEEEESYEAIDDLDVPATSRDPRVRTLKEPPNIWDLVHENRKEFNPATAFVGRLASRRYLVVAAILLFAASGAAISLMMVRDSSGSKPAAPLAQSGRVSTKTSSPQRSSPSKKIASAVQQRFSKPAQTQTQVNTSRNLKSLVASAGLSGIRVVTELPREEVATSTRANTATLAHVSNKNRTPVLRSTTANSRGRNDYKDRRQTSTSARLRSDTEKNADSTVARKEPDKAVGAQASSPVKTNSAPKAKVIPWP